MSCIPLEFHASSAKLFKVHVIYFFFALHKRLSPRWAECTKRVSLIRHKNLGKIAITINISAVYDAHLPRESSELVRPNRQALSRHSLNTSLIFFVAKPYQEMKMRPKMDGSVLQQRSIEFFHQNIYLIIYVIF